MDVLLHSAVRKRAVHQRANMVFGRKDIGFRGLWEVEVELEGIEGMYVEVGAVGE